MTKTDMKFIYGALMYLIYLGYKNHKRISNLQHVVDRNAGLCNNNFEKIFTTLNTLNYETDSDAPLIRWKGDIPTWHEEKEEN